MTDRDLTPAAATHDTPYGASEARAEVEAFMGEGFECSTWSDEPDDICLQAHGSHTTVTVFGSGPTYRAAVDALKQAWRDAVRPWVESALVVGWDHGPSTANSARVLKEDQ